MTDQPGCPCSICGEDANRTPTGSDPHTLRTRIAAAIYNACDEYTRKLMVRPDCPGASELEGDGKPVCYTLADAVSENYLRQLGRCPTCCGRWPLYVGAYDKHGKTVRCAGCVRIPAECRCG